MEIKKQEALEDFKDRLLDEVPEADGVIEKLERAGLQLKRAEPTKNPRTWLLFWEPPGYLRESFDLAPEILVVLSPWKETQARDVSSAEDALRRDHRLDRGVVLMAVNDRAAERRLSQPVQHTGRLYIFMHFDDVVGAQDPQRWLRDLFQDRIGSGDLFAAGRPVFGWDFVGRMKEIRAIRGRLLDGRPVGLYGLRKAGKTSVLIALRDQLIHDATAEGGATVAIPIHVDLLSLSFAEMKRSGFMRYLLRSMHEALERLGIDPTVIDLPESFANRRRLDEIDGADIENLVPVALECLIDWARSQPASPAILVLIDEYERILGASRFPIDDGLDILDYLRGLVQRYPGTFNLLIAGLDRERASRPRHRDRQNPLFNFVVDYPLAGLERGEMDELVRKIGRRVSLRFEAEALEVIWQETGGHPYLAREFGRVIDRAVPAQERKPKQVDRRLVLGFRDDFRRQVEPTMQEIQEAVCALDKSAPDALAYAASFPAEAEEAIRSLRPESAHALRQYGILNEPGAGSCFRIGCFGDWLLQNQRPVVPAVANG